MSEQVYPITHIDASNVVRIIDVVTKRGAFEGAELTAIGQVRTRFASIVEEHAKSLPPPADDKVTEVVPTKA